MPSRSSFGGSDAAKKYARREYRSDRFAMPDIEALADLVTSARGRFWREAEDRSRPKSVMPVDFWTGDRSV